VVVIIFLDSLPAFPIPFNSFPDGLELYSVGKKEQCLFRKLILESENQSSLEKIKKEIIFSL